MARSVKLVALLLLVCTHAGIVHSNVHIWATRSLSSSSPIHLNCFLSAANDHVTQVNWVIRHTTTNRTTIAVSSRDFGVFIHPSYKEILHLHEESSHNVSITFTRAEVVENGTAYCCTFVTFRKGILEECLVMNFTNPKRFPSLCHFSGGSHGCGCNRIKYIATLLVGACFLIGICVLLYCIQKMRHRKSFPLQPKERHSPEVEGTSDEVQMSVKRMLSNTPFSPLYVMINLEYVSSTFNVRTAQANSSHTSLPTRSPSFVSMDMSCSAHDLVEFDGE